MMIYKCRVNYVYSCIVEANSEDRAKVRAAVILQDTINRTKTLPAPTIDDINVEPLFMNKKITLPGGAPLSGEY